MQKNCFKSLSNSSSRMLCGLTERVNENLMFYNSIYISKCFVSASLLYMICAYSFPHDRCCLYRCQTCHMKFHQKCSAKAPTHCTLFGSENFFKE